VHITHESRTPKPHLGVTPARIGGRSSFWRAQLCASARFYVQLLSDCVHYCTTTFYYFQKDVRGTALLPFFLHQLTIDYFKQLNMLTVGNGTAGVSSTGPGSEYNPKLSRLFIYYVYSVLIQIKREHEQSLCCHNIAHSQ
jgi:hypothetical protein